MADYRQKAFIEPIKKEWGDSVGKADLRGERVCVMCV